MRNALLASIALVLGCRDARSPGPAPGPELTSAGDPTPTATTPAPAPAMREPSIYDLELALVDQDGRSIGVDVHRGHPTLIAMFYASCPAACPRLIHDLGEIVAALPAARRAEVRVLLVSFDPARDTPDQLRRLAVERELDLDQWTLATATELDARALAAVLGVKYRRLDSGELFHSSVITALDRDGVPLARLDGFVDTSPIVHALQ